MPKISKTYSTAKNSFTDREVDVNATVLSSQPGIDDQQHKQMVEPEIHPVTKEEIDKAIKEDPELSAQYQPQQTMTQEHSSEQENFYIDEYGEIHRKEPNNTHNQKQQTAHQDMGMRR